MPIMSTKLHAAVPDPVIGITLSLAANALVVVVGVCVRILSNNIDVFQILLFRQLIFMLVLIPASCRYFDVLIKPAQIKLHIVRIFGAFASLLLGYVTVSNLPLAEAAAIGFTSILFVALLSALFLKESVGKSRRMTLLIGFIGVLLVVQPSFENMTFIYSLTGLCSAIGAAVAVTCIRQIAKTEPTISLLVYQALFVGLFALVPAIVYWQWPTPFELLLLLLVGTLSSCSQWLGVTAYRYGEANIVSNVGYSKMIYSLLLGYFVFAESPGALALIGAGVIVLSVIIPHAYAYLSAYYKQVRFNEQ